VGVGVGVGVGADTIEPPLGAGAAGSLPILENLRPHPRIAVPDLCLGLVYMYVCMHVCVCVCVCV
jgi:hypothetical protein